MWKTFWRSLRSSPSQQSANKPDSDTPGSLFSRTVQIDRKCDDCDIVIEDLEDTYGIML